MIGDDEVGLEDRRHQPDGRHVLGDVLGDARHPQRLLGIGWVVSEHEAVILDRRAATRGRDQDRVKAAPVHLGDPGVDGTLGLGMGRIRLAHVVGERAAAALPLGLDDLDAVPGEEADRCFVEVWPQHALGTAAQERDAAGAGGRGLAVKRGAGLQGAGLGREGAGPVGGVAVRQLRGGEVEHRREAVADARQARDEGPERHPELGPEQRQPEAVRIGQHEGEDGPQQAIAQWPPVGRLDVLPGVIDEVHVMHAGRTGGHAGQAGQAAVDVLDHLRHGGLTALQHVLDQVDAPARGVELVAEQQVGRAGRGAEPAMDAGPQDFFRRGHGRVRELRQAEVGLHGASSGPPSRRSSGRARAPIRVGIVVLAASV